MTIAVLGATSHVAKNLVWHIRDDVRFCLYARSPANVHDFLQTQGLADQDHEVLDLADFPAAPKGLDAVVNCIGCGTPDKVRQAGAGILRLTEMYDDVVLDYLARSPDTCYVNFSSGAIYGTDFEQPASANSEFRIKLDLMTSSDAYRISKLNSEAKHRGMPDLHIIDLRLFGFFSRFIDLQASFLVSEMVLALRNKTVFTTDENDFSRDFIHPQDLAQLVIHCVQSSGQNTYFDVYSKEPVQKSVLVGCMKKEFGMKCAVRTAKVHDSPTGGKKEYYSVNHSAARIGYMPKYSSLDSILFETSALLGRTIR